MEEKLKLLKRNLLLPEERLYFNSKNGYSVERCYDISSTVMENCFFLYIDGQVPISPSGIIISLIYLNIKSKNFTEHLIQNTYKLPPLESKKEDDIKISIKIDIDGKKLWKIKFKNVSKVESSIYVSKSSL